MASVRNPILNLVAVLRADIDGPGDGPNITLRGVVALLLLMTCFGVCFAGLILVWKWSLPIGAIVTLVVVVRAYLFATNPRKTSVKEGSSYR